MRIEIINGVRVEYPDSGKWLHDGAPNYTRIFKDDYVILGKDAEPWAECSQAEREEYEKSKEPASETEESVEQPTE